MIRITFDVGTTDKIISAITPQFIKLSSLNFIKEHLKYVHVLEDTYIQDYDSLNSDWKAYYLDAYNSWIGDPANDGIPFVINCIKVIIHDITIICTQTTEILAIIDAA